jgi:hypothetical protein
MTAVTSPAGSVAAGHSGHTDRRTNLDIAERRQCCRLCGRIEVLRINQILKLPMPLSQRTINGLGVRNAYHPRGEAKPQEGHRALPSRAVTRRFRARGGENSRNRLSAMR